MLDDSTNTPTDQTIDSVNDSLDSQLLNSLADLHWLWIKLISLVAHDLTDFFVSFCEFYQLVLYQAMTAS